MADVSCRQINLDRPDPLRTFSDLNGYMDRRVVFPTPYVDGQEVTVAGAEFVLVDSSMVTGIIAKGQTTTAHGGLFATSLIGAFGAAAVEYDIDDVGNVMNLVELRVPDTNAAITVGDAQVFGLLQCDNSITDGDAVGATASENLQLTFVTIDSYDNMSLVSITSDVEFTVNKVLLEGRRPVIQMVGNAAEDVLVIGADTNQNFVINSLRCTVTSDFASNEVITVGSGAGALTGAASVVGTEVTIGDSAVAFNSDSMLEVWRNGAKQRKGVDVIWDSSTTIHFADPLAVGENFELTRFSVGEMSGTIDASYFPDAAELQATAGSSWSLSIPIDLFDMGGEDFEVWWGISPGQSSWMSMTPATGAFGSFAMSDFPIVLSGTPPDARSFTVTLFAFDASFAMGPKVTFTVEVS